MDHLDGDANEDVKKLQQSLNEKAGAGLATDGIYGEKTRSAVRSYQKANSLVADGIAGNETLGHLYGTGVTQSTAPAQTIPAQTATPKTDLETDWQNYLNREVFSYDAEKDPLYQQYRQQYTNLGQLAMEDTMGQAAALTGGYGNSYAQTAGQQTYQGYLQQLNNVMPELYGAAYNRYQAEGEALYNEILLQEQRKQDAYSKLTGLMALGYSPTEEELTAAGLTQPKANAIRNYYTPTYSGTTSGSYTGYDNGSCTTAEIIAMQRELGVEADGLWGKESQAAAKERWGTTNPDKAWRTNNQDLEMQYRATHLTGYNGAKEVLEYYGIGNAIHKVMTQEDWAKKRIAYMETDDFSDQEEITQYETYLAYLNDYVAYLLDPYVQ